MLKNKPDFNYDKEFETFFAKLQGIQTSHEKKILENHKAYAIFNQMTNLIPIWSRKDTKMSDILVEISKLANKASSFFGTHAYISQLLDLVNDYNLKLNQIKSAEKRRQEHEHEKGKEKDGGETFSVIDFQMQFKQLQGQQEETKKKLEEQQQENKKSLEEQRKEMEERLKVQDAKHQEIVENEKRSLIETLNRVKEGAQEESRAVLEILFAVQRDEAFLQLNEATREKLARLTSSSVPRIEAPPPVSAYTTTTTTYRPQDNLRISQGDNGSTLFSNPRQTAVIDEKKLPNLERAIGADRCKLVIKLKKHYMRESTSLVEAAAIQYLIFRLISLRSSSTPAEVCTLVLHEVKEIEAVKACIEKINGEWSSKKEYNSEPFNPTSETYPEYKQTTDVYQGYKALPTDNTASAYFQHLANFQKVDASEKDTSIKIDSNTMDAYKKAGHTKSPKECSSMYQDAMRKAAQETTSPRFAQQAF